MPVAEEFVRGQEQLRREQPEPIGLRESWA
jgi:hypothetical protein